MIYDPEYDSDAMEDDGLFDEDDLDMEDEDEDEDEE